MPEKSFSEQEQPQSDWEILGIEETDSLEKLHTAYRKSARESHKDGGGSDEAFIKLREAYERAEAAIKRRVPPKVIERYEDAQKPDSDNHGSEVDVNK
jgi:curved DNA-binding protein CbpA